MLILTRGNSRGVPRVPRAARGVDPPAVARAFGRRHAPRVGRGVQQFRAARRVVQGGWQCLSCGIEHSHAMAHGEYELGPMR